MKTVTKKIVVISDCDGCLTDGNFIYTADGKVAKIYGAHDADGVKLLKKLGVDVVFISADKRGWNITKKRIDDMKCPIYQVSEQERVEWVKNFIKDNGYEYSVFFGDGINDCPVCEVVSYFAGPANSVKHVKNVANYITDVRGGQGAFLDLALHLERLFANKNFFKY